ncbi:hypothetical protein AL065_25400 [Pseudomonas amygdali pv. ulmi]|uniref:hypothetical protein n=1 Tax=Pseudomonas amygdali TaxID=47877 RepID=UPI00070D3F30|nr:hypothetical protein [Pseudomonas amygdali]KWS17576.1 hypothetical protein AL065_25400 [Pseudomonas amygdali pv. ulmi]
MLNQFAKGLLVATSMAPILGAVAVNQIAQDRPWSQWLPWLAVTVLLGLICWLMLMLVSRTVDAAALAKDASPWFCKRFALLKDSEILDQYTVPQIIQNSIGYDLDIHIDNSTGQDRIVFPTAKALAKKLLQFLNEKRFRGATTERLFETNLKRRAG